jgi:hypothetical protein
MTKPTIKIHNAETGEVIEREMNAAEFKQYEAVQVSGRAIAQEKAQKEAEKAALLARLGLTSDEAKLLLS